jgi:hypothetical protein
MKHIGKPEIRQNHEMSSAKERPVRKLKVEKKASK